MARAKLYGLSNSHPAIAVGGMLDHKGIDYELTNSLPGLHPVHLRLAGFRGGTVPALKHEGRKVQGSVHISRFLDSVRTEPRLFPVDADERRGVEEAEGWGEAELQSVPRRCMRWGLVHREDLRLWLARASGVPGPAFAARTGGPSARLYARMVEATDQRVRADLAELPSTLDRVDGLIADGVIGGDEPNAADFQVLSTIRSLLEFTDLRELVEGRPAAEHARRLFPEFPGPVPAFLPAEWLPARSAA